MLSYTIFPTPLDTVIVIPAGLSATAKDPMIHFYGAQWPTSEGKGDRASYVSMHSPQAHSREEEEDEHVYEQIPDVEESQEVTHDHEHQEKGKVPRETTI